MLRKSLLKEIKLPTSKFDKSIKFEKWIDDGKDIGGRVDFMILNENEEIEEIVDFKSGNIFEFKGKKKVIKMAYILQLALYAHIVKSKQLFYPKCYIQDIKGNKYEVEVIEEFVCKYIKEF
ncbi:MAG: PD-(D/E)XK nuclease family protein [Bacteroidetes bacterium]|nr:PD-(D/E)XK nuclease family protein [Bacteroidota bacterium]